VIDLHTHILFDVDDGAHSIEDSISMLKTASSIGIKHVVLTPHVSKYRPSKCSNSAILDRFEDLKKEVNQRGIEISLYLGAEIDEHDDLIETVKSGCNIHKSKYVLVDFTMRTTDISEVIYEMNLYGYKVIIAHPERIDYIDYETLISFKKEGALFQVSSNHLVYKHPKSAHKIAMKLLKDELIDIVSSDAHDMSTILSMKKAFDVVLKKKGKDYAQKVFVDFPKQILENTYLVS
jgi:protein-tyrosine phosphatase